MVPRRNTLLDFESVSWRPWPWLRFLGDGCARTCRSRPLFPAWALGSETIEDNNVVDQYIDEELQNAYVDLRFEIRSAPHRRRWPGLLGAQCYAAMRQRREKHHGRGTIKIYNSSSMDLESC